MKKTETKQHESALERDARRGFLKGAAVASAAVGGGALAANVMAEEVSEKPADPKLGYQETDHVREYYRLARF